MAKYKLEDIFELQLGKTPSRNTTEYWNTCDNKWISIGDLTHAGKYISETKEYLSDVAVEDSGIKMIPANTVVMSFKLSIGKTAITSEDMYSNEAIMAFLDKHVVEIMPEYIYYMFNYKNWDEGTNKAVMGKTLNKATLSKVEIEICSIEKQKEIVELLDQCSRILEARNEELERLDELIKARFVEMFGDARENPKGFKTVPFVDIVEYMGDIGSNGANKVVVDHLDMKDEEDYAMMVRFTNFTKNDFVDDVKYVSKEAYDFFKKSQIFGGELIICKIGSAGQNYVMPYLDRPVSLGLNQIMVRIKDNILMPYLYQYLHTEYGEFLISGCINGAVTKTITKTELKKIPVMMPSMELQNQFAEFVKQVDKSKVAVQKALDEAQLLFDSLMQEYFG